MREIEIKILSKNLKEVELKAKEQGCIFSDPIIQHDTIYSSKNSNNDFWEQTKEGDIILRIRRLANTAEFNLKQQRSNEMDNIEYETKIENPEAMHQILFILGWTPSVEVKKVRRKGKIGNYKICLDQVEELGDFVELEKMTDDNADPNQVREELFQVLESLGLSRQDEEIKGYDTQIFQLHLKK